MSIDELVQKQLDYYNNHDLEGFISTYDDDVRIFNQADNTIMLQGKNELKIKYRERFEVLKVQAELKNRMVLGNKVIDHEEVRGLKNGEPVSAIAIYEIKEQLIKNVWFIFE